MSLVTVAEGKEDIRKYVAHENSNLVGSEQTQSVLEGVAKVQAARWKADNTWVSAKQRAIASTTPLPVGGAELTHQHVMMHRDLVDDRDVKQAIAKLSMVTVTDPAKSNVFVVPDPGDPGQRLQWYAVLFGIRIVSKEFLQSGGRRGASVVFKPAISTRRAIWMSARFLVAHPSLAHIVQQVVGRPGNKWRIVPPADAKRFRALKTVSGAGARHTHRTNLGLVTHAQKQKVNFSQACMVTAEDALKIFGNIDVAGSSVGVARL